MSRSIHAVRKFNVQNWDHIPLPERTIVSVTKNGVSIPGIDPQRITSLDENVMSWTNADHIYGWFVDNVLDGKARGGSFQVSSWKIQELLAVCEKVLNGSHLVKPDVFKAPDYAEIARRAEAEATPPKVIKNVAAAHKLLPLRDFGSYSTPCTYGEAYLKQVEETRDWAERMLIDERKGRLSSSIYVSVW